jgi:hypothetical protein
MLNRWTVVTSPGRRRAVLALALGTGIALAGGMLAGNAAASPRAAPALTGGGPSPGTPATALAGTWRLLPAAPVTKPYTAVGVWARRQMILHGLRFTSTGRRVTLGYRPASNTWAQLARGPKPPFATEGTDVAAWTGSEMLVPGLTNGAYRPATNTWRPLPPPGAPTTQAVVGWTGRQLILWGGTCCAATSNTGTAYSPAANSWRKLPRAPLPPRSRPSGGWDGKELIVAGGTLPLKPQHIFLDAAAYNPVTRTWRKLPPMPRPRLGATAVWDGREMLFLGGTRTRSALPAARGLAFNPATNRWRLLPLMEFRRSGFAAVWTGRQVLVWGGLSGRFPGWSPPPHGEVYTPATDRWTALPVSPLAGRASPVAVWTGRQMIVWGGEIRRQDGTRVFMDGAAYTPRAG